MNALKNFALVLLVAGVGYLLYQHLSGDHKPTSEEKSSTSESPKVEVPGLNRTTGANPSPKGAPNGASASPEKISPSDSSRFVPASRTVPTTQLPDPDRTPNRVPVASSPKGQGSSERATSGSGTFSETPSASGNPPGRETKEASSGASLTGKPPADSTGQQASLTDQGKPPPGANASGSEQRRPDNEIGEQFVKCMQVAREVLQQGQWTEVLVQLSPWYQHPELTQAESRSLTELLDQLAGSVIYSREHRLEPPYRVRPGDSLIQIARTYQISWELLAKINGIRDPNRLDGVEELKVIRGPFHAIVDVSQREITLMLELRDEEGQTHPLYAGRFPIRAISGISDLQGQYEVLRKSPGPRNRQPGPMVLELSDQVLIHGPASSDSLPKTRGTIELSETDMDDLYDILTIGSRVLVRR